MPIYIKDSNRIEKFKIKPDDFRGHFWKLSDELPEFDLYIDIGQVIECLPMVRETGIQSQVKSYQRLKKWYLIPPCLKLSIIRYVFKSKVE